MCSYKLNNSYTVYVPNGNESSNPDNWYIEKPKILEWKIGAKVNSYFYGIGKIISIDGHDVSVHFTTDKENSRNKRIAGKYSSVIVTFESETAKKELRLVA